MPNSNGRRRASDPARTVRVAGVRTSERPRDPHREARRRRRPLSQIAEFAASSGIGQRAAIALAATGLILTVTVPATVSGKVTEDSAVTPPAATPQPKISAQAGVRIDFSRSAVVTQADPDGKLRQLLNAQPAGAITRSASAGSLGAPLDEMKTTSPFGYRISPITGGAGDFHRGQDYAAACGTPALAAAAGTVTFAGWSEYGGGNRVVVKHTEGLKTSYNHLASSNVKVGQTVSRGDVVAFSGTTGASTGCHLHFEVEVNGDVVDPTG